jgi:hypothetical protein
MHVGGDYHNIVGGDITSKQNLEYSLRHGVKHLKAEVRNLPDGGWDPGGFQAFAFSYGYMKALIQAVNGEA